MAYSDFPMPPDYPDYAAHHQVADYFQAYVDQVLVTDPRRSPHALDQLTPTEGHPGAERQRGQKVELGAGERDRGTLQPDISADGINSQRSEGARLWYSRRQ